jgi:hypothetical protein
MTSAQITAATPAQTRASDAGADVTSATAKKAADPGDLSGTLAKEAALEERVQRRLLLERQRFDLNNEERAEWMREQDAMRDMMMAQLKDEDAYLKKWIEMI